MTRGWQVHVVVWLAQREEGGDGGHRLGPPESKGGALGRNERGGRVDNSDGMCCNTNPPALSPAHSSASGRHHVEGSEPITGPFGQMPGSAAPTWGVAQQAALGVSEALARRPVRESEAVRLVGVTRGHMRQGQRADCPPSLGCRKPCVWCVWCGWWMVLQGDGGGTLTIDILMGIGGVSYRIDMVPR